MLKAIFAQENKATCLRKTQEVAEHLRKTNHGGAAKTLEGGIAEMLTYTNYPAQHWLRIRTNNGIERIKREIRRRTHTVGCLPETTACRCWYAQGSGTFRPPYGARRLT